MQRNKLSCVVALALSSACAVEDFQNVEDESLAIVNGQAANIADFPWQVSLRGSWGGHFCGGSILNERWVLTANHCIAGTSASSVRVIAGVTRQSQPATQTAYVSEIIRYPGYSNPEYGKDAALLHLSAPLDLGGNLVKAIPIVSEEDAAGGVTAEGVVTTVSGWGALSGNGGGSPDTLQRLDMPIVSQQVASDGYPGTTITADMLPVQASASGTDKSPCYGDSGGPLVVSDGAGGHKLAGIVSWGDSCGGTPPAVYGRVSAFAPWIREQAFDDEPPPPPPPPPTDVELANGVPVTGLGAPRDTWLRYTITVPEGAASLVVRTEAGPNQDADLYVKRGAAPTGMSWDCRPYEQDSTETCTITSPAAGVYHVAVHAYTEFANLTLTASY